MRILQVVQTPQRRGAEVFASQLSGRLRRMGHDVRTAYLYRHDEAHGLPVGVHDCMLGGDEHHYLERLLGIHPVLVNRLRRVVVEMRPDIVQVNGGRTVKYGAALASCYREPRWGLIYRNIGAPGDWVRGYARCLFYSRLVMPRVHGVIGVSVTTLHSVSRLYRLSVPKVCIPCAIDPEHVVPSVSRESIRAKTNTPSDARVVLYVGRLAKEKRLDRLLRVIRMAKDRVPDLYLWIVGDGPTHSTLQTLVSQLSLADCVRFCGIQQEVANYMNAADVVALSSDTEGMPAVVLEAGWLRRPTVATRVGGMNECVLDGRTGILIEPNDEPRFAQELAELIQRPERLRVLGDAARDWVEEKFTIGPIAEQYAAFYEAVLARRPRDLAWSWN